MDQLNASFSLAPNAPVVAPKEIAPKSDPVESSQMSAAIEEFSNDSVKDKADAKVHKKFELKLMVTGSMDMPPDATPQQIKEAIDKYKSELPESVVKSGDKFYLQYGRETITISLKALETGFKAQERLNKLELRLKYETDPGRREKLQEEIAKVKKDVIPSSNLLVKTLCAAEAATNNGLPASVQNRLLGLFAEGVKKAMAEKDPAKQEALIKGALIDSQTGAVTSKMVEAYMKSGYQQDMEALKEILKSPKDHLMKGAMKGIPPTKQAEALAEAVRMLRSAVDALDSAFQTAKQTGNYAKPFDALNQLMAKVATLTEDPKWLDAEARGIDLTSATAMPKGQPNTLSNILETAAPAPLTPRKEMDQAAIDDPQKFLKEVCHNDWNEVRALYRAGKLSHPNGGMQAMLNLREAVITNLLEAVKARMADEGAAEKLALNEAIKKHNLAVKADPSLGVEIPELTAEELKPKPLSWDAAGSTDATSDIDLPLRGDYTEKAARILNEEFVKVWKAESGVVFDVNFYSADYIPTEKFTDGFVRKKDAEGHAIKDPLAALDATKKMKFEAALEGPALAAYNDKQHVYAQYKIRLHMTGKEWDTYKDTQLKAVDGDARAKLEKEFKGAQDMYDEHVTLTAQELGIEVDLKEDFPIQAALTRKIKAELAEKRQRLPNQAAPADVPKSGSHEEHAFIEHEVEARKMGAENRIYERLAKDVETTRNALFIVNREIAAAKGKVAPDKLKALEDKKAGLEATLMEQLARSITFANEPYITQASVLHVVANKQMLTKGVGAAAKLKSSKENIQLTADQYMHSFKENLGDCFKVLNHKSLDEALVVGSKYFYRLANAAKHLEETMPGIAIDKGLREQLSRITKDALTIKKDVRVEDGRKATAAKYTWVGGGSAALAKTAAATGKSANQVAYEKVSALTDDNIKGLLLQLADTYMKAFESYKAAHPDRPLSHLTHG